MLRTTERLPEELTTLVNEMLDLLGQAIKLEFGASVFQEVERIRKLYKGQRSGVLEKKLMTHQAVSKLINNKSQKEKLAIAHSFAASLELINACESAYRSHRLRDSTVAVPKKQLAPIIFVLTAHPTEARSPVALDVLEKISDLLLMIFQNPQAKAIYKKRLFQKIVLLMKVPISKTKAPTIQDEAEYIYSIILKKRNIEKLCDYYTQLQPVYIRTWVGGDKDGHPGVNDKAMLGSLGLSRQKLIPFVLENLQTCYDELVLVSSRNRSVESLCGQILLLKTQAKALLKITENDGQRLKKFYKDLDKVMSQYESTIGVSSPELEKLSTLLKVFPGLVVPLELREDSSLIKESLTNSGTEIIKMLKLLRRLSKSGKASWYVRGIVISMCEFEEDVRNTIQLLKKHLGELSIPVVPLFETRAALESSSVLTSKILEIPEFKKALNSNWDKKYEVMVGYSDSAKESGALFSRVVIEKSLSQLDRLVRKKGYIPIFFHGSGGSVARGGGSLKEQMAWWPKSAQQRYKATIQGEMIHRTFSSVEIFERHVSVIRQSAQKPKAEAVDKQVNLSIYAFAEEVRLQYFQKVTHDEFMQTVAQSTPYPYLDQLKIGSRPSKRKKGFDLKSLRAIPWVLCWTQTRVLFPVWWGIGQSWAGASSDEKRLLKKAYRNSSLFRSFVDMLSYTLAKVDLSVWAFSLETSNVDVSLQKKYLSEFKAELRSTRAFIQEVTGKKELLWFRSWLEESIKLRSTLIYPLNILEVSALKSNDVPLLRETVTGVASGMLTTG